MTVWTVLATVVRVIDGDTVECDLDLGWHVCLRNQSVRIAHINAPELKTPEGKMAKVAAALLLPVGAQVTLVSHELDKYGRVLGTLTLASGQDFGTLMIEAGNAVPYEGGARG